MQNDTVGFVVATGAEPDQRVVVRGDPGNRPKRLPLVSGPQRHHLSEVQSLPSRVCR